MAKCLMVLVAAFLLLSIVATAEAKVWIVALDGSGNFTSIQAAVNAAADGDTILVRDGTYYEGVTVSKGVTIVGRNPDTTIVHDIPDLDRNRALFADHLPSGRVLTVSGLRLEGVYPCVIAYCDGTVVIADNLLHPLDSGGSFQVPLDAGRSSLVVISANSRYKAPNEYNSSLGLSCNNATIVISQYEYHMERYWEYQGLGSNGGAVTASTLYMAECAFTGDHGQAGLWGGLYCNVIFPGTPGGAGLKLLSGTTALIAGRPENVFTAGNGGTGGVDVGCGVAPGGDGGDGIDARDAQATISGVSGVAGLGGPGNPPGKDGEIFGGNVTTITPPLPTARIESRVVAGQPVTLRFFGQSGQSLVLLVSTKVGLLTSPVTQGFPLFAVPGGQFLAIPLGSIPGNGEKLLTATVPNIPGIAGSVAYVQGVVIDPSGQNKPYLTNVLVAAVSEP